MNKGVSAVGATVSPGKWPVRAVRGCFKNGGVGTARDPLL